MEQSCHLVAPAQERKAGEELSSNKAARSSEQQQEAVGSRQSPERDGPDHFFWAELGIKANKTHLLKRLLVFPRHISSPWQEEQERDGEPGHSHVLGPLLHSPGQVGGLLSDCF